MINFERCDECLPVTWALVSPVLLFWEFWRRVTPLDEFLSIGCKESKLGYINSTFVRAHTFKYPTGQFLWDVMQRSLTECVRCEKIKLMLKMIHYDINYTEFISNLFILATFDETLRSMVRSPISIISPPIIPGIT